MTESAPRLWTKDFIIVSSINFILALIFYLLMVTIAVYAVDAYGASTSEAGLITGIFIIGALTGRLLTGRVIDSFGRRRILFIGLSCFIAATFLYFIDLNIAFLLFTRFVHGISIGIASTATGTIVAQIIPDARKGEGIGYFSMSTTLSTAVGPFIGLFMTQHFTFQLLFVLCLLFEAIGLVLAFFLKVTEADPAAVMDAPKGLKFSSFVEPRAVPIACITLAVSFCYGSVLSFISFYAIELDLVEAAGFFFLVYAIAVLLSRPFTGRLMDRKNANVVMYPALFILAAGMLLLSSADGSVLLLLSGALIGLGFGNIQSTTQAIAVKLTPPHRFGLATSTFFIFMDAGLGFGPYLQGFLISQTSYSMLYAILGAVVLATVPLYYMLHGRKEKPAMS
ncbi:MFS transporter [Planococcus lenghuensis]|uniref:MFS transporter n=1 Tax=Planococcus lenghuensis TaxID=2213202 RepID=A0A1Q2L325_9BACL|nr:MFS transporter [Planococcus lenghuensis]AQQ54831.1 MFS transporter [Planococcus lenghuensis]